MVGAAGSGSSAASGYGSAASRSSKAKALTWDDVRADMAGSGSFIAGAATATPSSSCAPSFVSQSSERASAGLISAAGSASALRNQAGSSAPPKTSLSPAGARSATLGPWSSPNQSRLTWPGGAGGVGGAVPSQLGGVRGTVSLGADALSTLRSHSGRFASPGAPAVGSG